MSLRARIVGLVVGAVVLTLLAMGLPGRRIALQEFEASVHAVLEASDDGSVDTGPLHPSSLAALEAEVRTPDARTRRIWITPDGTVRASNDRALEGAEVSMRDDGFVELELASTRGVARMRFGGGQPVVAPDGSDAGRAFRLPAIDDIDVRGANFSRALDRRLLLWAGLVLTGGIALAFALVGHTLGPLQRLQLAAHRISGGDLGARAGAGGPPEIRAVAHAFDQMAQHLESSEVARRRMIRNVAHDLRTPLTNLQGQLEALQDGLRDTDEAALASLHEEALLLSRLVSDLEGLARADTGALRLSPTTLDLGHLVREVVDGFVKSGRLDPDRVHVAIPETLRAFADPDALGRALRNIVDNAVVHAPSAAVEIAGRAVDDAAELTLRDHGPGIDPAHLPHVTERLYRADAARGRDTGGSGLGLAIALELVRASGGTLAVESAEGGGTLVVVRLPYPPSPSS